MTDRIVQVVQHLQPGGLENVALNLAKHSRFEHHIISLDGEYDAAISVWQGLGSLAPRPIFLNKPSGISGSTIIKLARLIKQLKPLAVHTHHIGPLFYTALGQMPRRLTLVHTEHDAWHLQNAKARHLQTLLMYWAKPQHVSVGSHVAATVHNWWPKLNSQTILNSVDMQRFSPQDKTVCRQALQLPEDAWIIACAARLEPVKGVDVLIRAHANLPSDSHLALGGLGSQREVLAALCDELGTRERVHFLGHVEMPEQLYGAADVYCQPSRQEGLPLAPIEAQACGTPCVVSAVGASAQISGWPGSWTVPAEDSDALANTLNELYRQPLPSPRESVQEVFDIQKMSQAYDALYVAQSQRRTGRPRDEAR